MQIISPERKTDNGGELWSDTLSIVCCAPSNQISIHCPFAFPSSSNPASLYFHAVGFAVYVTGKVVSLCSAPQKHIIRERHAGVVKGGIALRSGGLSARPEDTKRVYEAIRSLLISTPKPGPCGKLR